MAHPLSPDHVANILELAPAVPELALLVPYHEIEDPEEDLAEENEEMEEEMDVDDDDEMNEPELIFPYEEADPLNPPPPGSDSKPEVEIVPARGPTFQLPPHISRFSGSVYIQGEPSSAAYVDDDGDSLMPGCMRRDINSLFEQVQSLSKQMSIHETAHARVEDREKAYRTLYAKLDTDLEDRVERKKLERDLEEARLSNTILRMDKERIERYLYQTRAWAYGFYQEMVQVRAVREEGSSEVVDILATLGETSPHKPRGSPRDLQ
ncbi:hypothetical protein Tco_0215208 [Tanacetum coccineum]